VFDKRLNNAYYYKSVGYRMAEVVLYNTHCVTAMLICILL